MNIFIPAAPISPLRQRLIDDMMMREFSRETQRNYIRDVGRFATFLGRSPATATADDVRRFQIEQREAGVPLPTMNGIVSALRFFFTHTVDRPNLSRKLVKVTYPRKLPVMLSRDEAARLLQATTCLKHQAALSVGRVHPPFPAACPATRLPPYSPLRLARQRDPQGQHRPRPRTAGCSATVRTSRRRPTARSAATLSLLRRPHAHH